MLATPNFGATAVPARKRVTVGSINPIEGVMLGLIGQVGIADGGENGVMAEEFLYFD